jgi:lysophospholipase L1-like esterase
MKINNISWMKRNVRSAFYVVSTILFLWACKDEVIPPDPVIPTPPPPTVREQRLYVVLGSSTAEGVGPSRYDSSWVGRCITYLRANKKGVKADSVINLARGGYSSYNIIPSGDPERNITKALSLQPYAIIVNMPTNDIANGGSVENQMNNFATIADLAKKQNVILWVTTSQPRNLSEEGRLKLLDLRDRINSVYGVHSIDFWTTVANSNGMINSLYDYGDGIHLNNGGHRLLFARVLDKKVFNE